MQLVDLAQSAATLAAQLSCASPISGQRNPLERTSEDGARARGTPRR